MLQRVAVKKPLYTEEDTDALLSDGKEWNFHGVSTQLHLHTLHPYPAKFIPQIPSKAISTWSKPGDLVYDPFCGCGTTLLEASLLGRRSIGTDNNAVAILISKAKIAWYPVAAQRILEQFLTNFDNNLSKVRSRRNLGPSPGAVEYWFSVEVMDRLSAIKGLIAETPEPAQTLLMATFSSIIVRVSYQDSDTRYARVPRIVSGEDVDLAFKQKLARVIESIPSVRAAGRAMSHAILADACEVPFIEDSSVDFIVTSPPYLNAYDYHKYHRQRLHWIDGDVEFARDFEIGSHDQFTKPNATPEQYFLDMSDCFSEWHRILKPGAHCLVVIGDAIVSKTAVPVGDKYVGLGKGCGLQIENRWIRELQATKRAFNVKNSRMSHEHMLLFRK